MCGGRDSGFFLFEDYHCSNQGAVGGGEGVAADEGFYVKVPQSPLLFHTKVIQGRRM